jgi:hypothetical protein
VCLLVVNRTACGVLPRAASRGRPNDAVHNLKERKSIRLFVQGDTMRFAIIVTLTAAATLATVRAGSAQNDQREAPKSAATRDARNRQYARSHNSRPGRENALIMHASTHVVG